MKTWADAVAVLGYFSLLLELTVFHVPSVASSLQILTADSERVMQFSPAFRRVFRISVMTKAIVVTAPLLIIYSVFVFPLVAIVSGRDPLGDYVFVPGIPAHVASIMLILGGRTISLSAAIALCRARPVSAGKVCLNTEGLFRWSRNPGLLGMYCFCLGLWFIAPSIVLLIGILFYAVYMHFKILMEEDYLARSLGNSYIEYCMRTERYLG